MDEMIHVEASMRDSFLRYSMSVIVDRALPDVRDGLKPVHRRVIYGMEAMGLSSSKPTVKSARIVGEVMGKYHPHGDSAIYDTLVRLTQDFSLRYMLAQGQGNFGSIDGDSPAAMRYTEARMSKFTELMLQDIDEKTVDWQPNYDGSTEEPTVLPSAFPNLIVNGSSGIAVGMATNMAPHNLREAVAVVKAYIADPDIDVQKIQELMPGPDFPTGGIVCGRSGIRSAYATGRGRIVLRARTHVEDLANGRKQIVATEIPYQVNKAELQKKVADLVREKRLDGISDIRDESDRDGMRVVIELKRDANPDVVLSHLFKYTQFQTTFAVNNIALVDLQPRTLPMKELVRHYVDHRHEVVVRRTEFRLAKARERAHILEGLRIAQANIDEVVRIIRSSANTEEAKANLEKRFELSDKQSEAIVQMRLRALTSLEADKIEKEYADLVAAIAEYEAILASRERRMAIICSELDEVVARFGDERRTTIEDSEVDIDEEDFYADVPMVITLSETGYVKRMKIDDFRAQGRGGVGLSSAQLKEEDSLRAIFVANNHSYLLAFTDRGRGYWLRVFNIPECSRGARGKAIVNLLPGLQPGETVKQLVPVRSFRNEGEYLLFATREGVINKIATKLFANVRRAGLNVISLDPGDELVDVVLSDQKSNLMLATAQGQAIVFPPSAFRSMGRGTHGVRGIRLEAGDVVIGMVQLEEGKQVLTVSANGYGKRTPIGEYRVTNRGGKGIRNMMITEKTGPAVSVAAVADDDEVMVTSVNGTVIRTAVAEISTYGRSSQGVRVIRLREGDAVRDMVAGKNDRELDEESAASAVPVDSGAIDPDDPGAAAEPVPEAETAENDDYVPEERKDENQGDDE